MKTKLNLQPMAPLSGHGLVFGDFPSWGEYWIDIESRVLCDDEGGTWPLDVSMAVGLRCRKNHLHFLGLQTPDRDGFFNLGYVTFMGVNQLLQIRDAIDAVIADYRARGGEE